MGREVVYCDICGIRLLHSEFEKNGAVTIEGKTFCPKCRDEAGIVVEPNAGTAPAPLPPAEPTPSTTRSRIPSRPGTRRVPRTTPAASGKGSRRPMPQSPPKGNPAVVIGAAIGGVVLLLIIIIAVASSGGNGSGDRPTGTPDRPTGTPGGPKPPGNPDSPGNPDVGGGTDPADPQEARDKAALEEVKKLLDSDKPNPMEILTRIEILIGTDSTEGTLKTQRYIDEAEGLIARAEGLKKAQKEDQARESIRNSLKTLQSRWTDGSFEDRDYVEGRLKELAGLASHVKDMEPEIEAARSEFKAALNKAADTRADELIKLAKIEESNGKITSAIIELGSFQECFQDTEAAKRVQAEIQRLRNKQ